MKLQALASRIHPQVALNQREAKHLLSVLQSSFRKQLDAVHPTTEEPRARHVVHDTSLRSSSGDKANSFILQSSRSSAVQHLDALLMNPLFMYHQRDIGLFNNETLAVIKDPVGWFVSRVAQGKADNSAARLCLNTVLNSISKTETRPLAVKEALKDAQVGTRVIEWMWSYGLRDISEVQKDPELLSLLVKPLVAENKRQILERWLLDSSVAKKHGWRRLLFERLLRAEVVLGADLNQAILYFWEMSERLRSPTSEDSEALRSITRTAGLFLTLQIIKQGSAISLSVYNCWLAGVINWSSNAAYYTALLKLHHPQTPDAAAALKYLHEGNDVTEKAPKMVRLCLDTAELLLAQENYVAASWVMEKAKTSYAVELGFKAKEDTARPVSKTNDMKKAIQHNKDERQHVELLEQLSFG